MARPSKKPLSVFVVDDSPSTIEVIRHDLESKLGCIVQGFGSAEECLRNLDEKPDLILCDYMLDGYYTRKMNGDQMLYHLRKNYPHLPVIMYSAHQGSDLVSHLMKLGATDFVPKEQDYVNRLRTKVKHEFLHMKEHYREKSVERVLLIACVCFIGSIFLLRLLVPDWFPYIMIFAFACCAVWLFVGKSASGRDDSKT
ncbi:MAG: response regulator receiver protein [Bacteroidetes bacterium]|nr:MAG: response regulator receiver protein [Bacteroidota bacterium]